MSTRGLWGFTHNGKTKVTYNHFDSYPSGLGDDLVKSLNAALAGPSDNPRKYLEESVDDLELVTGETPPTPEQISRLYKYYNPNVGSQKMDDWYNLLRETQGRLAATLTAGFMLDGWDFGYDSLFCEWGYVIDLDANLFTVCRGFQNEPVTTGLWSAERDPTEVMDRTYYSIKPVGTAPITDAGIDPDLWEALKGALNKAEEDE